MATRGRRKLAVGNRNGPRSCTRGGRGSRGQRRGAANEDWVVTAVVCDIGVQLGEVHSHTRAPRLRDSLFARPGAEEDTKPVVGCGSVEKKQFPARHVAVGCFGQGGEGAHFFDVHANGPLLGNGDHAMGAERDRLSPAVVSGLAIQGGPCCELAHTGQARRPSSTLLSSTPKDSATNRRAPA